jgi:hypothetical protein
MIQGLLVSLISSSLIGEAMAIAAARGIGRANSRADACQASWKLA